jgi:Na+/H+ antiporter NhaD/arsenite permease-like protein
MTGILLFTAGTPVITAQDHGQTSSAPGKMLSLTSDPIENSSTDPGTGSGASMDNSAAQVDALPGDVNAAVSDDSHIADKQAGHSPKGGMGLSASSVGKVPVKGKRSHDADHGASVHGSSDMSEDSHGHDAGHGDDHGHHGTSLGEKLPLWSAIPFAGILLSIAILPLVAPTFWHHHFGKISAFWGLLLAIPYLIFFKGQGFHDLLHILLIDYIPFIILLWGLYTAAGGIVVRGSLRGTPGVNLLILAIGTIIASWIGTTGAAMLLIRPLLRANQHRKTVMHSVVFFIFLVANIGGSLTPLGDPPLFLGFLHGVPFFWTTTHMFIPMCFVASILLILYFLIDTYFYRKEGFTEPPDDGEKEPLKLDGLHNLLFLGGIVGGVLMSGSVKWSSISVLGVPVELQNWGRDGIIVAMGILSLITTKKAFRKANGFTWFPIMEVAKLFAGIFITIVPALAILQAGEKGAMGAMIKAMSEPWHFYWITGLLSSFLDNAPTYLTFFNTALGKLGCVEQQVPGMLGYLGDHLVNSQFIRLLTAISCGAVFMGANTYIGNAPNFMVKSIAEENKIKMPSFFGYMFWSVGILVPLFVVVTFVFF